MLVQNRSFSIMGTILESDNSNVGTLGRRIPVQFYAFKKYVNLVDVLTYMIKVGYCFVILSRKDGNISFFYLQDYPEWQRRK